VSALDRQIINIVDTIAEGVATVAMKAKLIALEGEKETLSAKMAGFAQADNVVVLHPAAVDAYRKKVAELQAALTMDDQERREAWTSCARSSAASTLSLWKVAVRSNCTSVARWLNF